MKYKTWLKIGFFSLLFGWLAFIWVAVWASWNREVGLYVFLLGISFCLLGTVTMSPLLRDADFFKSIDELEAERERYREARKKLERKILEL